MGEWGRGLLGGVLGGGRGENFFLDFYGFFGFYFMGDRMVGGLERISVSREDWYGRAVTLLFFPFLVNGPYRYVRLPVLKGSKVSITADWCQKPQGDGNALLDTELEA